MKTFLLCLCFLLLATEAQASKCIGPQANASFGQSFYGATTLTAFLYDTDYDKMYVSLPNVTYITYLNVPLGVAYQFAPTKTPDKFYAQQIAPRYKIALETNTCLQLVTDTGTYITVN